ncbi:MAG: magnesium/cobalt transporter CorA, partial [Bacteroidales bacterium]|nr:magnesium/cobalt transporter CorA [Bacteroidales bacterium]
RPDGVNWIQVHGLQDVETVVGLCRYFGVDFLTVQDVLNSEHPTKVERHDDCNVVIVKLLERPSEDWGEPCHLAVIQGKGFVLTFVESETVFFDDIVKAIGKDVLKVRRRGADFLLGLILNSVMAGYMSALGQMEDQLEELEESLLERLGSDVSSIEDIQKYRRRYRMVRKSVAPLKEQFVTLIHSDDGLVSEDTLPFYRDVNDHLQAIFQSLESCRDAISSLTDLYLSNNDQRMNSIMKQLTVVSTLFIPLTFFAGIWGMNFKNMPELEWEYGYIVAWVMMLAVILFVFLYFKRKKWY